jgi:RHH-type rel operon transcriptional repressor/antitoxin RelB
MSAPRLPAEAIVAHLDEWEEIHLAESRLEDLRAGRSGSTPLSDVMDEYRLGLNGGSSSSS